VEENAAQPLHKKTEVKPQPTATSTATSTTSSGQSAAAKTDKESGYLDIPAFLRRQAD
jgi:cell division protein FtsZ